MLIAQPAGHYHFLKGIAPYSCGVVADPGYEIVRVALATPLAWRDGFRRVDEHLRRAGLGRQTLCAMELRSPKPFTMPGFIAFNQSYCAVLRSWDLFVDDLNPIARTNVCPLDDPPEVPSLHAFCYVQPNPNIIRPTLIVAGAGELRDGVLKETEIIRPGDVSPAAMLEKATYVMRVMDERLRGLGGDWSHDP